MNYAHIYSFAFYNNKILNSNGSKFQDKTLYLKCPRNVKINTLCPNYLQKNIAKFNIWPKVPIKINESELPSN